MEEYNNRSERRPQARQESPRTTGSETIYRGRAPAVRALSIFHVDHADLACIALHSLIRSNRVAVNHFSAKPHLHKSACRLIRSRSPHLGLLAVVVERAYQITRKQAIGLFFHRNPRCVQVTTWMKAVVSRPCLDEVNLR